MTLYELRQEFAALRDMSEELDEQTFADTMEAIAADIEEKADAYSAIITEFKGQISTITAEINRLREKKDALSARIDIMKDNLTACMIDIDRRQIRTALHTFTVQKNPARVVFECQLSEIPAEYMRQADPVPDKEKIKSALKLGVDLSGIAHLEQDEGVRIR